MTAVTVGSPTALTAQSACGVALNRLSRRGIRDDLPALFWAVSDHGPILSGQFIATDRLDGWTDPVKAITGWGAAIGVTTETDYSADRPRIKAEGWHAGARVRFWAYLDETTTTPNAENEGA